MLQFVLLLSVAVSVNSLCLPGWSRYGNSCYHISRDIETWSEAMRMCELHGGFLAHIDSAQEMGFIANVLHQNHHEIYWFGGTDWVTEGHWIWEPSGNKVTYTNWYHHQPNNAGNIEHCMTAHRAFGYRWADEPCHSLFHYVCEMSDTTTASATAPVMTTQSTQKLATTQKTMSTSMKTQTQTTMMMTTTSRPYSTTTPLE